MSPESNAIAKAIQMSGLQLDMWYFVGHDLAYTLNWEQRQKLRNAIDGMNSQ